MSNEESRNETNSTRSSHVSAMMVSLGILMSRILGLVREKVFAHYLGNSLEAAAFRAALRIPNFLQNLFGEGALSASFIPVYSRLRAHGQDETARALAGAVGSMLAVAVSVFVAIGVWLTPVLVDLIAPGFEGSLRLLTIEIVQVLFPGVGFLVLSAWCLGILNSHRKFFLSYVSPVFWNLALIVTLVTFGRSLERDRLVVALAWGSILGSVLQFGVQVPSVFHHAGRLKFSFEHRLQATREVLVNFIPMVISRGVVQVSAFLDTMIASFLGATAVAGLGYAQTLYLLPISLFGMAVAAAELPELASSTERLAAQQGTERGVTLSEKAQADLRRRLAAGSKRIAFFVIPSMFALMIAGRFIITLLLQSGQFGEDDTVFVWLIVMGSSLGLLAATWSRLLSSAFYALSDTRTPLRIAIARVAFALIAGSLLAFPLRQWLIDALVMVPGLWRPSFADLGLAMGAVGLSLGSGLAAWLELGLLKKALGKLIGPLELPTRYVLKIGLASIVAGAAAWGPFWILSEKEIAASPVVALAAIMIFGVVYLIFIFLLKIEGLDNLLSRLRRR